MPDRNNPPFFQSLRFRYGVGLLFFLAVGGFFLWQEHSVHIMGYLPLILILGSCIGMHFFMHGGKGHGHGNSVKDEGKSPATIGKKDAEK